MQVCLMIRPPIIEISLKLSNIYRAQENMDKAYSGYKWCTQMAKKYLETDNSENSKALYGITLDAYSRFLYETGNYKEALPVMQESISVAEEIDVDGDQIKTLKINFSSILAEDGRFDESLDVLNELVKS